MALLRSDHGVEGDIPPELDRWNWGAFLLNWIWGLGNSVFIALLCLVPVVNIVMMFVLGARGSRWAWRNGRWRSAEHFRRVQRNWAIAGAAVWLLFAALIAGTVITIPALLKRSDPFAMTMQAVQADGRVAERLGTGIRAGFFPSGSISVQAGGTGEARLAVPVTGAKGSGTAYSSATRSNGRWTLDALTVVPDAGGEPIDIIGREGQGGSQQISL